MNSPITLTVIVPAYNEEKTINTVLEQVKASSPAAQLIVVDDGSSDDTGRLLKMWKHSNHVILLSHTKSQGKGAAIRTAIPHAKGKFTIIQDADLEYSPVDYDQILEPLKAGSCQMVYGSRFLPASITSGNRKPIPRVGVQLLNLAVRLLYGSRLSDLATCYKAFTTELLRQMDLQCQGFEFCAEVTAKACRLGILIHEVPIRYTPRSIREGKKIRWWHGISMLSTLWKYRHWRPVVSDLAEVS